MEAFVYKGKEIRFNSVTGTVAGAHKRYENRVSGSGGGTAFDGTGRTKNISIQSQGTVKQEFFLKKDDGKQVPVQLTGEDIPIMDGQKVTMISVLRGKKESWLRLLNHDSERVYEFGHAMGHATDLGLVRLWLWITIGIAIWIVLFFGYNGWVGSVAGVGFCVFGLLKTKKAGNALTLHIDGLIKEFLHMGQITTQAEEGILSR